MKIMVINGSSREEGNTEWMTNHMLKGVSATYVALRDYNILPIIDQRHDPSGFQEVDDDFESIIQQVLKHDLLFFATPLYWYGMSGLMKNFVDRWSQSLRSTTYDFRSAIAGKEIFFLIVGGEQVHRKALPLVQQFYYFCDFLQLRCIGYLIAQGTKPGTVQQDRRALMESEYWNQLFLEKNQE